MPTAIRRWTGLPGEAFASLRRPLGPGVPSSWPLDAGALAGATLRWPSTYGWEPAKIWVEPLARAMGKHVRVQRVDLPQRQVGVVEAEWDAGGQRWPIAFDYSDYGDIDEAFARGVGVYFKMMYRAAGYSVDGVVPAGYVPSRPRFYRLLGSARRERDRARPRVDVYGRFSLAYAPDTRRRAVELLNEQDRVGYQGGLRKVPYSVSLREAAQARVCVDLPGNGTVTHRLPEYLAIGACVVRPRPDLRLPEALRDGEHVVFCKPDLSDLVDLCERMVVDTDAREQVGRQARAYFDSHLHREQLAAYYLRALSDRLPPR